MVGRSQGKVRLSAKSVANSLATSESLAEPVNRSGTGVTVPQVFWSRL